ncbi:hypothetical protein SAMD00019534_101960 [Acytostelium subglobosum LB1]|uniref:hypothetical protein n=1 Tax=Acytostelium subglobosum LB1 TaxID=1410327 RepID=UPI0006449822|nr:hypothetical protein SAMD00019534_101960 [Acytostelium subglobosum LB1]GAM27021.1 hypothetical protein SAMD00019534_101960 [Acytostelium subglobosum LB1]|eukprot:XP_012749901.1 hypothetical protein SAMD00019534_101960 [Acytostelium subglobosum LB1]
MSQSSSTSKKFKVMIAGAGLGGLVLAGALQKYAPDTVEVAIFERDPHPTSRVQGYLIGINKIGTAALKDALSPEKFQRIQTELFRVGTQFIITNKQLEHLMGLPAGATVNRVELRRVLMEGLDITYNKRIQSYTEHEDGRVEVTFVDGTKDTGDFLVGAGRYQVDREEAEAAQTLSSSAATYNKIDMLIPNVPKDDADEIFTNSSNDMMIVKIMGNKKNTAIIGRSNSLQEAVNFGVKEVDIITRIVAQNDSSIGNNLVLISYQYRPEGALPEGRAAMLEVVRKGMEDWHPLLRKMVNELATPEHVMTDQAHSYFQATPTQYPKVSRVTLLGDAAHAMTSHAGMGGNTAMKDGLDLAKALIEVAKGGDLQTLIGAYEKEMLRLGFKAVNISRANSERMHANDVGYIGEAIRNRFMKMFYKLVVWGVIKLE